MLPELLSAAVSPSCPTAAHLTPPNDIIHPPNNTSLEKQPTHVRKEGGVTADPAQADEELQGRAQVTAPLLITHQSRPGVLHLCTRHIISILTHRHTHLKWNSRYFQFFISKSSSCKQIQTERFDLKEFIAEKGCFYSGGDGNLGLRCPQHKYIHFIYSPKWPVNLHASSEFYI